MPRTNPVTKSASTQRLDKWLWYARVVRTRTLAMRLIESGKVRVNRARIAKPSRLLKTGDVITLTVHGQVKVMKVLECGHRRGPAVEAQALYEDLSPPPIPYAQRVPSVSPVTREKGAGRPTKRDRRRIDAWRASASPGHLEQDENQ